MYLPRHSRAGFFLPIDSINMNVTIKMSSKKRARSTQKSSTTSTTPRMEYYVVFTYSRPNYGSSLTSTQQTRNTLTGIVNDWIEEGWEPQGGVSISVNKNNREVFAQAMVREIQ